MNSENKKQLSGDYILEYFDKYDFRKLLYEDLSMYPYNQYSDISVVEKIFKIFSRKIKEFDFILKLFFQMKSFQSFRFTPYESTEFFIFLIKNLYDIPVVFGGGEIQFKWDSTAPKLNWEGNVNGVPVTWDSISGRGVIAVNKLKSIVRFINDLNQNNFNLLRFIQCLNEFCEYEDGVVCWVDSTSFPDPLTINVNCNKENESINEFSFLLMQYQNLMPLYTINFIVKDLPNE